MLLGIFKPDNISELVILMRHLEQLSLLAIVEVLKLLSAADSLLELIEELLIGDRLVFLLSQSNFGRAQIFLQVFVSLLQQHFCWWHYKGRWCLNFLKRPTWFPLWLFWTFALMLHTIGSNWLRCWDWNIENLLGRVLFRRDLSSRVCWSHDMDRFCRLVDVVLFCANSAIITF